MSIISGVAVGLLISHVRLHLGLPGHKALMWMTPIIFFRFVFRSRLGATAGTLSAASTSLAFGGSFAGGVSFLPLVGLAGMVVDATLRFVENRRLPGYAAIPLIGLGGMIANLACLSKRLFDPTAGKSHFIWGLPDPWADVLSYALFGLLAGLLAATLAILCRRRNIIR